MNQRVWRLYRLAHGPGLDGLGGTMAAGRWHHRGQRVVYFGFSPAVVVLERLAHTDPDLLPVDLHLACFELPAATILQDVGKLPANWPLDIGATQQLGTEWIQRNEACGLRVPSVILPEESNVLWNTMHPQAHSLKMISNRPFTFDSRLL